MVCKSFNDFLQRFLTKWFSVTKSSVNPHPTLKDGLRPKIRVRDAQNNDINSPLPQLSLGDLTWPDDNL